MEHNFILAGGPKICFGINTINQLGVLCRPYGKTVLLVTGNNSFDTSKYAKVVVDQLNLSGGNLYHYKILGEPSANDIDNATSEYTQKAVDIVVAIGGGSVLDAGKAISAMLKEEGSVENFLEGVGTKSPSGKRTALILIPTTAGTGSEATKNAVITKHGGNGYKKSLRHDNYVPDIALVDPCLTMSCSKEQTAASGMDAFTQLLESFLSTGANNYTDALALSGLKAIFNSLERAVADGGDLSARSDIAYASLLSGICLANAGLGLIHGFAQPLGSYFSVPHGIVCGSLMGIVNEITLAKLRNENHEPQFLKKYASVGRLCTGQILTEESNYSELLIDYIYELISKFNFPGLSSFGISETNFSLIIKATDHKNHPVQLENSDLITILKHRL